MPDDTLKEDFAQAIAECLKLCDETVDLAERKHRLAVRKELNRLHRHYEKTLERESEASAGSDESEILDEVRNHLEPLGLAAEDTPVTELARLAALVIAQTADGRPQTATE